ncbi:MAG TPA: NAD(+) synthase [Bryobacteraceae bacterium]|nr:NAD(+) synthase [Bryobacteraceae bacterium]
MYSLTPTTTSALAIDVAEVAEQITSAIRDIVFRRLGRKGIVLGLSGGIDSSVVAALCVRAVGPKRVVGLLMPETESAQESLLLGQLLAWTLGIQAITEDISAILEAAGCYRRRDAVISRMLPAYGPGWTCKIVLADVLRGAPYQVSYLVVRSPDGVEQRLRFAADAYRAIVAANNFKQRARKMMEYYHADRLKFAVAGTPNRLEHDQGFFVKRGDGDADLKPIAHLYKTQVYQLAEYLNIPEEIRRRTPTTDTYSEPQSQEEFFFALPYDKMDLCVWGRNNNVFADDLGRMAAISSEVVARAYQMIDAKRKAAAYLHEAPLFVEPLD